MTLTVQDLVTKFDDFADDAKVKAKIQVPNGKIEIGTDIIRDIVDIKINHVSVVILVTELPLIKGDDHEESEDEKSEDEESEDEESEDENELKGSVTLTVQDLVTKFNHFGNHEKVNVERFIVSKSKITYTISKIVNVEKDDEGNMILVTEFV
jgi:hypothetical protein